MRYAPCIVSGSLAALMTIAAPAAAQCEPFDFDDMPLGTPAATVIPGVYVYAVPGTCGGPGSVRPIIVQPWADGSSRALGIEAGCPDFSIDYLRLVFDEAQTDVSFLVGEQAGAAGVTLEIRAYNAVGGLLAEETRETAGGIDTFVRFSGIGSIRRIEVESPGDLFECIDDLVFATDRTPPLVLIDAPLFGMCVCDDTIVTVFGEVYDPDGEYVGDELWYRSTAPGSGWTFVNAASGPFSGPLHDWSTVGVPEGHYYLRVTGRNGCGLESTDVTTVRVDRSFGQLDVDSPASGETVCGVVNVSGLIDDPCGVASWVVGAGPAGSPMLPIIAAGSGQIGGMIAEWDTRSLTDGDYVIDVGAIDACGHISTQSVFVTVDNTSAGPCGCLTDLNGDGGTGFADLQILLQKWGACGG